MSECKQQVRTIIPENLMLSRLAHSEQMREFFIQMWIQNSKLAKQGGMKVHNLLSPLADGDQEIVPVSPTTFTVDMEEDVK